MKILRTKDIKSFRDKHLTKDDPITGLPIINPTLDHDHASGYCRGVLDRDSNQFLGKVESAYKRFLRSNGANLYTSLEGVIKYLQNNLATLEVMHPKSVTSATKKFSRLPSKLQERVLLVIGASKKEVSNCKTKNERLKLYKKYLLNPKNIYKV